MCVDRNQCDTRWLLGEHDAGSVHSFVVVMSDCVFSENVFTHFADERNISAKPLCCDCLIGALAAGAHSKFSSKDGLARNRKSVCYYGHIGVAAADDHDLLFAHID